ncbi:MAG TPA: ribosomal protein S18-alanine N-acetyltransferase [Candidatus Nanopelagicaceae bacterium]|nr:ribosomal protein S18-alanine N-acetyltransferase [Candidatus Nanopelagicaceae bacterium]
MSNVTIRSMTQEDLEPVYAIERITYQIDPWSRDQLISEIDRIPETRYYTVAESNGEIIGYGGLFSPSVGVEADIQTLTVTPEFQDRGIGRALLLNLLEEADRRKAPGVLLEVRAGNDAAIHLYKACGFTEISRRPNYYGRNLDALIMRKLFDANGSAL